MTFSGIGTVMRTGTLSSETAPLRLKSTWMVFLYLMASTTAFLSGFPILKETVEPAAAAFKAAPITFTWLWSMSTSSEVTFCSRVTFCFSMYCCSRASTLARTSGSDCMATWTSLIFSFKTSGACSMGISPEVILSRVPDTLSEASPGL